MQHRQMLKALDGISFNIKQGETFSLVGESGCGKSTLAKLIVGLDTPSAGEIEYKGTKIGGLSRKEMVPIRNRIQMIFQDPYASLNPRWKVGRIIAEPLKTFRLLKNRAEIDAKVRELLHQVGLASEDSRKFPHEFSGGQRQRISIARALASKPEFLVCDEPTSALDVSVQAQILNLMRDMQRKFRLTYLFISHDLAVVYNISDRVGIMYLGRLVEVAPVHTLFKTPRHPYTRMLLNAVPDLEITGQQHSLPGDEPPNPINPPQGCAFHPRCSHANKQCRSEIPLLSQEAEKVSVACHRVRDAHI
jgi:peptide/nickel transport system ATP-binding protein